jgi:hypothetical protein
MNKTLLSTDAFSLDYDNCVFFLFPTYFIYQSSAIAAKFDPCDVSMTLPFRASYSFKLVFSLSIIYFQYIIIL